MIGVLVLFLGFAPAAEIGEFTSKVFDSFNGAYIAVAAAGILALTALLPKLEATVAPVVAALSVVGALVIIFQYSTADFSLAWGALMVLILSIIAAAVAVFWLLVEAKLVKVAPTAAVTPSGTTAVVPTPAESVAQAQAPAAAYGDAAANAYGQASAQQTPSYDPSSYAQNSTAGSASSPYGASVGGSDAAVSGAASASATPASYRSEASSTLGEYPAGEYKAGEYKGADYKGADHKPVDHSGDNATTVISKPDTPTSGR